MSAKKWSVSASVVGTKWIGDYDAETGEEAIKMAYNDAHVSLCHACASECEDPAVEHLTAVRGDVVVTDEETWQDQARAAGWTPPQKGRDK